VTSRSGRQAPPSTTSASASSTGARTIASRLRSTSPPRRRCTVRWTCDSGSSRRRWNCGVDMRIVGSCPFSASTNTRPERWVVTAPGAAGGRSRNPLHGQTLSTRTARDRTIASRRSRTMWFWDEPTGRRNGLSTMACASASAIAVVTHRQRPPNSHATTSGPTMKARFAMSMTSTRARHEAASSVGTVGPIRSGHHSPLTDPSRCRSLPVPRSRA
jgi:hypothetical protein